MKKFISISAMIALLASCACAFSVSGSFKPAFGERIPMYSDIEKSSHTAWVSSGEKVDITGIDKINGFYKVRKSTGKEGYIEFFAIEPDSDREVYKKVALALARDKASELRSIDTTDIGSPLKIIDAYLTYDQEDNAKMNLEYHNIGEKPISEYAIMIYCYDSAGRKVLKEGTDNNIFYGGSRGLSVEADATGKSSWSLRSFPGTRSFMMKIYLIKFGDNAEWPVPVKQES